MIRPVRIHGIFDEVDKSVNGKGLDPTNWLAKKAEYKKYLDSLNIKDESLYERLLEEFNEGLMFNIDFKFLMAELGYGEDVVDALVTRFDAGEKPYGTTDLVMDDKPNEANYKVKGNPDNISVDPNVVSMLLDNYRYKNEIATEGIKRGM